MNRSRRSNNLLRQFLIQTVLLVIAPAAALAGVTSGTLPEHAHQLKYGAGWECDWNYVKTDGACALVKIPEHAYLNSDGDRWECARASSRSGFPGNQHTV